MRILFYIFFVAAIIGLAPRAQAQEKIGFTNIELILAYMPETEQIEKQLATMEKKITEQLEIKQKYYQQKLMEYMEKKQKGTLSESEEAAYIKELQKLEGEVQQGLQLAQQKLLQKRMELLKPIQDKMQNAIDQVAKEGGYTYILNQAVGSGIPSILYGAESMDVTEKIAGKLGIKTGE